MCVCVYACVCMQTTGIGHRVERPPVRKEGKGRKEEGGVSYTFLVMCVFLPRVLPEQSEWSRYGKGNQRRIREETIHS